MAEAAALCLEASRVAKQFSLPPVNFLTDNQSMANFYNSRDIYNPPHWNIKTYTSGFLEAAQQKDYTGHKVSCQLNLTA
jgi:hypothetical protein